ncbi:MAG: hypothetical protein AAGA72_18390 [Pseudomonadota bacterium]
MRQASHPATGVQLGCPNDHWRTIRITPGMECETIHTVKRGRVCSVCGEPITLAQPAWHDPDGRPTPVVMGG